MEAIKLLGYVDEMGHLVLDLPLYLAKHNVEVIVQVQTVPLKTLPIDFFSQLDAIDSDDLIDRPEQLALEVRDEME